MLIPNTKRDVSKGFTLVELLIAIIIIGILAGTMMIASTPFVDKAKFTADLATLRTLNSATITYKMSENVYDKSDVFYGYNTDKDRINVLLTNGYISSLPVSNKKGNVYVWGISDQKWWLMHILNGTEITTVPSGWYMHSIMGSYSGTETVFKIPSSINGVAMVEIMQDVFNNKHLTSVTIEDGIARLHARAFKDNQLTEIRLPESLKRIDTGAFMGNPLKKITISANVTIENNAFPEHASFMAAYTSGGAGTYILTGVTWARQQP